MILLSILHEATLQSALSTGREEENDDGEEKGRRRQTGGERWRLVRPFEPKFQRQLAKVPVVIGWPGCHGNAIRGSGHSSS